VVIISGRYEDKCTIFTTLRERISFFNANNKHTLYTHNLANNLHTIKYKLLLATYFRMADYAWQMDAVHPRQDIQIVNAIKSSHVILVNVLLQSKEIWIVKIQVVWDVTLYLRASGSKPHSLTSHKTRVFSSTRVRTSSVSRKDVVLHLIQQEFTVEHFRIHQHIMRGGGDTNYYFTILSLNGAARKHTKRFSTSVGEVYMPGCYERTVTAVTTLKWQQINIM